jgi:hypothetical protein
MVYDLSTQGRGTFAHDYSDHVSILKFIERNWKFKRPHITYDWTSLVTLYPESPRLLQLSHLFLNND